MTRPAVIIGLGGTGQWVLTYLKKDLMELNNGEMPKNVRLISIDTVSSAEAQKITTWDSSDQAIYEKSDKRIGSIELDPVTELIHIGGDCRELADEIEAGKYKWLNWFDVKYWKYDAGLGRDNWFLDRGAGRFRQFGLLAVYKDLMKGEIRSEILKTLPAAIRDIQASVEGDTSFELILVSSVAGGTGSAMLVPLGVLAQHLFGTAMVKTRAIVVLPSAFSPGKRSTELERRGGAALRELARAMMPPKGYSATINFGPPYEEIRYSRPFDGIYFVDGTREGQPINKDPRFAVFPAVAGWLRQVLDERSGEWFTNFGTTNVKGASDPIRRAEGVFGVFGIKSLYMPVRSLQQTYRLKMVDSVIRHITDPVEVVQGALKRLVANNQPTGAQDPRAVAYQMLQQTAKFGDEQALATSFLTEIARIVQAGGKNDPDEVLKKAQAGWHGRRTDERTLNSWLGPLTNLPNVPDIVDRQIQEMKDSMFNTVFKRSDHASPPRDPGGPIAQTELTINLENYIITRLGGRGAKGLEDYGEFGVMARSVGDEQVNAFCNLLRLGVSNQLSADNSKGRVGYTVEVLKRLEEILGDFVKFLEAVDVKRGQLSPQTDLDKRLNNARDIWNKKRKTKPKLLESLQKKPSELAIKSEGALLQASEDLVNYVQEITLHNVAKSAVKSMSSYVVQTRKELERWETALLEGDKAQDISGMLIAADANLKQISAVISEDMRSNEIEELVEVKSREADIPDQDKEWAFAGISWLAEPSKEGLSFRLLVEPEAVKQGQLVMASSSMGTDERRTAEASNLSTLEAVLQQRFGQFNQVQDILVWCVNNKRPATLANELFLGTEPLTHLVNNAQPVMQICSVSVRKTEDAQAYTQNLERELRLKITGSANPDTNRPVQVIDSEDPYRLTAIRTQVGLRLEEFKYWELCQQTYLQELRKAQVRDDIGASMEEKLSIEENERLMKALRSDFTQNEEKQAVELEIKWYEDGTPRDTLNPRIVSLLGQVKRLRAALQCWVLEWIQEVEDRSLADQYHWELKVPDWGYEYWITPNGSRGEYDELQAIEAMVLVGKNFARQHSGIEMKWDNLLQILRNQRDIPEGSEQSPIKKAVQEAMADGGLVGHWEQLARGQLNSETNKMIYKNPAYHDLADYAQRYFKSI